MQSNTAFFFKISHFQSRIDKLHQPPI